MHIIGEQKINKLRTTNDKKKGLLWIFGTTGYKYKADGCLQSQRSSMWDRDRHS